MSYERLENEVGFDVGNLMQCKFSIGELLMMGFSIATMIETQTILPKHLIALDYTLPELRQIGLTREHLRMLRISKSYALRELRWNEHYMSKDLGWVPNDYYGR